MNLTTDPRKIRVLIVDDHIVLRMGLVTAMKGEPDMQVVAEAENGVEAVEAYRTHRPDIVVLDLRMPKQGGLETIEILCREFGPVPILVFSNYADGDEIYQAFKAGARGFVVKEMALDKLLEAVRRVAQGEQYLPGALATRAASRALTSLSARELEVLALLGRGLSNKEIGSALAITEGTVKIHVSNILAKLGVNDRTQAILTAVKRGLIHLE